AEHLKQRAELAPLRNDAVASLATARRIELPIDRPQEARGGACDCCGNYCQTVGILSISIRPHDARTRARTAPKIPRVPSRAREKANTSGSGVGRTAAGAILSFPVILDLSVSHHPKIHAADQLGPVCLGGFHVGHSLLQSAGV